MLHTELTRRPWLLKSRLFLYPNNVLNLSQGKGLSGSDPVLTAKQSSMEDASTYNASGGFGAIHYSAPESTFSSLMVPQSGYTCLAIRPSEMRPLQKANMDSTPRHIKKHQIVPSRERKDSCCSREKARWEMPVGSVKFWRLARWKNREPELKTF